ncbi:MAG: sulfatase/phosphatase domain-containing protein, partial [Armatimonadota bacterium]
MITHLDEQMGRVLRALEESGHADDTIVVFAGDNGLAVGQHGLLGKQNMYEHSVRVPLIFLGPGIPKGKRSDALCYLLDVFPTLCDIVGLRVPESVEGHSLLPVMRGRRRRVRDSLFFAYKDVQRAVRDERYKLIEYFVAGERKTQLFDLREDLAELHDLSDDPDHARRLAGLRKELAAWQEVLDDPLGRHGDL